MVQGATVRPIVRRLRGAAHRRIVVRKHHLVIAADLAQVALARAHRAPPDVPVERLEHAVQVVGQHARLGGQQIGHAVQVRRLNQMPPAVHVLLDQPVGGGQPALVQVAAHVDDVVAQLLHVLQTVHVDEELGVARGHVQVGAVARQLEQLQRGCAY